MSCCSPTSTCAALLGELGLDRPAALGHDAHRFLHRWASCTRCRRASTSCGFPPLSLVDKARLAGDDSATRRESRTGGAWRRSRSPTGFGGGRDARRSSACGCRCSRASWVRTTGWRAPSFIWAIIARMYAARRSGLKREMFGYVEGGYDTVLRRFSERLEASGVEIACGQPVAQVTNTR